MELKDIIDEIRDNWRLVLITSLLFGLFGVFLYYIFPTRYIASGSLFVSREVSLEDTVEFAYEGFYANQTAGKYTETVIGLLESVDIRQKALESSNLLATEPSLRKIKKAMRVKEAAPQLVNLTVKGKSVEYVTTLWLSLAKTTVSASKDLNSTSGDLQLHVTLLENSPVVYMAYSNIFLNLGFGVLLGFLFSIFYVALKEYLR